MGLAWTAWALPYLVSGLLSGSAAVFIYAVAPRRDLNRALSLTLFFGAAIQLGYVLGMMSTSAADAYAFAVLSQMCKGVVVPLYLVFLGAALDTPIVRPLRLRAVRIGLVASAPLLAASVVVRPDLFVGGPFARTLPAHHFGTTPMSQAFDALSAAVFVFALVAAISAFRRARPGPTRDRDRWFVLAFGTRDLALAGLIAGRAVLLEPGTRAGDIADFVVLPAAVSLYVVLLVYGVLRWHLFDLDLRIKGTIRRGTVAAAFFAVFLVVTQLAQNGLTDRFGWLWGGIAAGLLLFLLAPLQRAADRVADAAMPGVSDTEEYRAHRRAAVYEAALEGILRDGTISAKERAVLERLRAQLGLSEATAAALERDVRAARSAGQPEDPSTATLS